MSQDPRTRWSRDLRISKNSRIQRFKDPNRGICPQFWSVDSRIRLDPGIRETSTELNALSKDPATLEKTKANRKVKYQTKRKQHGIEVTVTVIRVTWRSDKIKTEKRERERERNESPATGRLAASGSQQLKVTCLVLMLQVQKPGTCGWPLTGCQAAATFTGASCAARSWRTSGTTTTSTSPAGLSVLSVVPRTHVATTCARTLNSNTPKRERSILMISWRARWRSQRATTAWIRYPKDAGREKKPVKWDIYIYIYI